MRVLLEIQRNQIVERQINAAIAIQVDDEVLTTEDPLIFGRSLTKPFQMKAIQAVLKQALDWKQKAVALASHNGDEEHVHIIKGILPVADQSYLELRAAPALGGRNAETSVWTNPCSGKHSAILLACRKNGWPLEGYTHVEHPYNQSYLDGLESRLGAPIRDRSVAPDGCLLPTYAMTVSELAQLYKSIAIEKDDDWIWEAAQRYPELIGGQGRLDTRLIQSHSDIFAKEGADGLLGLGIQRGSKRIGLVIKVAHGHDPANAERLVQPLLQTLGFDFKAPPAPAGQTIRFTTEYLELIERVRSLN